MTDEDVLRSLFHAATDDLHAPELTVRPRSAVVPLRDQPVAPGRWWPRRALLASTAAVGGAAAAVVAILGFGLGVPTVNNPGATVHTGSAGSVMAPGRAVLYRLASTVKALPAPTGRYAVQVEQQTEGSSSYLKATVIDSRTGDTWTYQHGAGVPAVLPMAPRFSPTEAHLQASDPTDPPQLRGALIAQAAAAGSPTGTPQTPDDLAVTQAINTLWNPLVQPALRAALVSVIASSPGVTTNPTATDSKGRRAIQISYDDAATGMRLSIYLDPSTGAVLENSEEPYLGTADPRSAGHDVYLSQYWTDTSPTVNPLNR